MWAKSLRLLIAALVLGAPVARAHAIVPDRGGSSVVPGRGGCLFSPVDGACGDEACRSCEAQDVASSVVVDCGDPANEWLQATIGECECESKYLCHDDAGTARPPERHRGNACVDAESCGAAPYGATGIVSLVDYQPGIACFGCWHGEMPWSLRPAHEQGLPESGHVRRLERPPKAVA